MREDKTNPDTNLILDRVLEFSKDKGLFECGAVIVGVSGGPDSVSLLYILKSLRDRGDISCDIVAFHCNHHLRPGVCDEEAEQVRQFCKDLGVDFKVIDFDCSGFAEQNRISEETAGRVLRYEAFEQYAEKLEEQGKDNVRIAIAHHKDDIAETMMMNLFRGSGLEGLVNPKSRNGRLIRPLLCLRKNELIDFLNAVDIKYATDLTNFTTQGTRNFWRNDILPRLGEHYGEDPSVPLTRAYNLLSDDLDFISKAVNEAYASSKLDLFGYPALSVRIMSELHPAIRSRVIRSLWLETFGDLIDFEEGHLKDCISLFNESIQGETTLDMPFGRKAYRHEDVFAFSTAEGLSVLARVIAGKKGFLTSKGFVKQEISLEDIGNNGQFSIKIPDSTYVLKARIIENSGDLEYNYFSWFCPIEAFSEGRITLGNCDGIGTALRMKRAGSAGGKELNRLMTDLKIPESARKQILFIECNGDVLWLPGYGHGVGFTNAISREKYIANRQSEGVDPENMVLFTIERQ